MVCVRLGITGGAYRLNMTFFWRSVPEIKVVLKKNQSVCLFVKIRFYYMKVVFEFKLRCLIYYFLYTQWYFKNRLKPNLPI